MRRGGVVPRDGLAAEVRVRQGGFVLDAELRVAPGECVALVGPSGAGKTTLLRALAGLVQPQRGRIVLGEDRWFDAAAGAFVPVERRRVGYVFQDYALFPRMRAWANVAYGMRSGSRAERRARAHELLAGFGLEGRAGARAAELSGGERQRVALARALASDPRVLLLDEPLSALDVQTRAAASRELAGVLATGGMPAVIVTHDFAEAAVLADRIAVVDAGRIVQRGTAAELAAAPRSAFVADLSGAVVLRGVARPGADGLTVVELDEGGLLSSTDEATGRVAASVFPWEIEIGHLDDGPAAPGAGRGMPGGPGGASPGAAAEGADAGPQGSDGATSALNHLRAEVTSVSEFGNRARIGLAAPQPLAAEVTAASVHRLGLRRGARVSARWKATATRLSPL